MKKVPRLLRRAAAAAALTVAVGAVAGWLSATAAAGWAAGQFGPALLRLAATGTAAAALIVAGWLVGAWLGGRWYCSMICPLGILQALFGAAMRRRGRRMRDFRRTRLIVAAGALGMLAGGWSPVWQWLDPYSGFVAIAAGVPAAGIAAAALPVLLLAALAVLVWKYNRIFCTAVCPVGTLLGLAAGRTRFPLGIAADRCVRCGRCVAVCPAGCLDPAAGMLDNARCLRCFNCLAVCPTDAVGRRRPPSPAGDAPADPGRRTFLLGGAAAAAAGFGAARLCRPGAPAGIPAPAAILPPGAGSPARLAARCTGCRLCVARCPGKVLRPAGDGGVPTVHLAFDRGMCEFNCRTCIEVCPTGALERLPLAAKRRRRIGLAEYLPELCVVVVAGTDCGACAEHCPTGALSMAPGPAGVRIPRLTAELCIGCGSCEYACPVRPERAIRIRPVPLQLEAADPEAYFRSRTAAPETAPGGGSGSGDWLI